MRHIGSTWPGSTVDVEYALIALQRVAAASTGIMNTYDLAQAPIPRGYIKDIMLALKSGGVVLGKSGPGGGYRLSRCASDISIGDVVRAIRPASDFQSCARRSNATTCKTCQSTESCTLESFVRYFEEKWMDMLSEISLQDLLDQESELE